MKFYDSKKKMTFVFLHIVINRRKLLKLLICPDMRTTTLMDVYNCAKGEGGEETLLGDNTIRQTRKCIDKTWLTQ
jgi:hypothetical protein